MLNIIPYPNEISIKQGQLKLPCLTVEEIAENVLGKEGYKLEINKKGILLSAETEIGLFYGQQTLNQLFTQFSESIPCMTVKDKPRYAHRGYMLDCSRHFFTVKEIKKQIDVLALLKINIFHWHLTDDQGWRVQIDKYPLLTEIGSKREQTQGDGIKVEGFYSKQDIKEIVEYCRSKHINVIPEIDVPGHFRAAIAAYPELSCLSENIKVGEGFGISPHIACAGKQSVYEFYYNVLDEIMELFPYEYIHLGGDEALKLNWINCELCQKAIKENSLKNEEQLQGYLMTKLVHYLNAKGRKVINWNDGMLGGNIDGDITVQYWKESKECKKVVIDEASKGRTIILSPFFSYYLDYPYGMTSLKKTYNYEPDNMLEKSILGLEAPLWTEHVKDIKKVEEMTYPRLIAVAERSWTIKNKYESFLTRVDYFNKILNVHNINYLKDVNPSFIKGKIGVIKFFINAFRKVDKDNIKAMRKTKALLNKKYDIKKEKR